MLHRFGIWFVVLFGLGLADYFQTHQWFQMTISMTIFCGVVLFTLFAMWLNIRIIRHSTNMEQIERLLRRRRKRPVLGCLYAIVRQDYVTARKLAAEEAFARDDIARADELGQAVIDRAKGLQRYVLLKGLEVNRANPDRDMYF